MQRMQIRYRVTECFSVMTASPISARNPVNDLSNRREAVASDSPFSISPWGNSHMLAQRVAFGGL